MRSPLEQHSPELIERSTVSVSGFTDTVSYLIRLYVHNHEPLFGVVEDGIPILNEYGHIAADEWLRSARAFPQISVDRWRVLPDRLEGIVQIYQRSMATPFERSGQKPRALSSFIASYKAVAAKRINLARNAIGSPLWQRNYEERFIPDEAVLKRIRRLLSTSTH